MFVLVKSQNRFICVCFSYHGRFIGILKYVWSIIVGRSKYNRKLHDCPLNNCTQKIN